MKILWITHQAQNSREFQAGLPGGWPRIEQAVDDKRTLTVQEASAGWRIDEREDLDAIKKGLEPAAKSFFSTWTGEDAAQKTVRDVAKDAAGRLDDIDTNWASLTAAQKADAMRYVLRVVRALLRLNIVRLDD